MSYFPDLSPYGYSGLALPGTVNIGWLEPPHRFPVGPTGQKFQDRLRLFVRESFVNLTRGFHICPFCPRSDFVANTGSAEIHVAGRSGRVFAAPSLIAHYVADHEYCPPTEFIEAVMVGHSVMLDPGSLEDYTARALLRKAVRDWLKPAVASAYLHRILELYPDTAAAVDARQLLATIADE
jgi:hypothetical protein